MNHTRDPIWATIGDLHDWLDGECDRPPQQETLLRMLKLAEEVGEVAQAVIGATGQNPRKGRTHSWSDVESELCDVIITAMVSLRTLTPDAAGVFGAHLRKVAERSLRAAPKSTEPPAG
ncbi:MazG-like family protein [Streptomyces sp. NBC_00829]|uniref:MazG-like family protein n=1 Tax=Streptomyces sp. NBC_00829 TaxID=2903679 RepID=UPI00386906C4|nr:MazG-like family protein [Streptomyces sp. NBC_00829]